MSHYVYLNKKFAFMNVGKSKKELCTSFLKNALDNFDFKRGLIYLQDKKKKWLICDHVVYKENSTQQRPFRQAFSIETDKCFEVKTFLTERLVNFNFEEAQELDLKINQLTDRKCAIYLPLYTDSKVYGVVCFEYGRTLYELTPDEQELLELQLRIFETCIEKYNLKKNVEKMSNQISSFNNNINAIDYTSQYEKAIEINMDSLLDILNGQDAYLMKMTNSKLLSHWFLNRNSKHLDPCNEDRICVAEWVLKNDIPFYINNVRNESSTANDFLEITLPLISRGKKIGAVTIAADPKYEMTNTDKQMLNLCSSHLAKTIENYELFDSMRKEKNYIENILNSSPVGIIIADTNGKILIINKVASSFLKLPCEGAVLEKEDIHCPLYLLSLLFNYSKDKIWPVEIDYLDNDGNELILSINITEAFDDLGEHFGYAIAMSNITERRLLQRKTEHMNKLASIGTVAAGVAHEIRNPLMSMSLYLDEIHDKYASLLNMNERKLIEGALGQIDRLDTIISRLLNYSATSNAEKTIVNINEIVESTSEFVRRTCEKNGVTMKCHLNNNLPKITIEGSRLKQALMNIYINAIQAMPQGGVLGIETKLNQNEKCVTITVSDTGIGIPLEYRNKIFEPFFSTKQGGIGLGLSITEKILAEIGGTMNISSEENQGTKVKIILPSSHMEL